MSLKCFWLHGAYLGFSHANIRHKGGWVFTDGSGLCMILFLKGMQRDTIILVRHAAE